MKTTKTTNHDLRCRGVKTDEDLARSYMNIDEFGAPEWLGCNTEYNKTMRAKCMAEIEAELGKERLEFLVHKIQIEERVKEAEDRLKKMGWFFAHPRYWTVWDWEAYTKAMEKYQPAKLHEPKKPSFFSLVWEEAKDFSPIIFAAGSYVLALIAVTICIAGLGQIFGLI